MGGKGALTVDPHVGNVGADSVIEEGVADGDEVALVGAVAALLRERDVAEERVADADADVSVGVVGQLRRGHVPHPAAVVAGVVPALRYHHVDATDVQTSSGRFVEQTRPFPHNALQICK